MAALRNPDATHSPRAVSGGVLEKELPGGLPREATALDSALSKAAAAILARQHELGYWVFDLEADSTIPSEYILLQRFMGRTIDPGLAGRLASYIRGLQLPDGGWPLYEAGDADISATVKAYFALKLCGDRPEEPHMERARRKVLKMGGAEQVNVFTRITLALFGQIPWRTTPAMPIEIMHLPRWFFLNLSKVSYWSRTVIAPLLVLYAKRPVCELPPDEGVRELFSEAPESLRNLDGFEAGNFRKNLFIAADRVLKKTERFFPKRSRRSAIEKAERFVVERTGEGGIGAIFPAMANAVMAFKVLGYSDDDPVMKRAVKALDDLLVDRGSESFCQPCVSPVWDTCLSLSAALESGVPGDHGSISSAVDWLMKNQIFEPGDWSELAPGLEGGGWAFQFENTLYPDLDDTSMVLMALMRAGAHRDEELKERFSRGVNWIIGMQSSDGGWGAFDIDNNRLYLNEIPFADHGALLDPPTSDLTGRCVELLSMLGFSRDFPPIARGIEFLKKEQEDFGGWFGRWGVNYIYGTWSVLSGLRQAGEDMNQPYVRRAVDWLLSVQKPDGGWGETCYSYNDPAWAGRGKSTASQTSWALLGLMAAGEVDSPAVERAVEYLTANQNPEGEWDEELFTGTGFPKVFYLKYHGYSRYFPLWALSVYRRLKSTGRTLQDEVKLIEPADMDLPALRRR